MTTAETHATIERLAKWADEKNVCETIDEIERSALGQQCVREFKLDEDSRREWEETVRKADERFRMKVTEKNYPFEKASNVRYPILATATLHFAARAYGAIIPSRNIVRGKVLGKDPEGEKRERAERIGEHMSHQFLDVMTDWEEETDIILHQLPIAGCAFRKTFYDEVYREPRSEMVTAMDFVVHNSTKSLESVPRATQKFELYPHEIDERIDTGLYVEFNYKTNSPGEDKDAPHEFIEQYRFLDLDEDDRREPWIVTVHVKSATVVRIKANFRAEDVKTRETDRGAIAITRIPRRVSFTKYSFIRDPAGGFYDLGFGMLLETLSDTIDSTLNQLMDAGNLQNAGGGFIGSSVRLKRTHIRLRPGKYEVVMAPGGNIRNSIVNHQHPGPSTVLYQLLGLLIESAERLASVQDVSPETVGAQMPATTALALIEQGQKVYTAIYKRIYRALKHEFALVREINKLFLSEEEYFTLHDDPKAVASRDYADEDLDVVPISDPNMTSDTQKLARAQVVSEAAASPHWGGLHNQEEALRRYYAAASIDDVDTLIQKQEPPDPQVVQKQQELTMRGAEAEVAEMEAKAEKEKADAVNKMADAKSKDGEQQLKVAEIEVKRAELQLKRTLAETQRAELELKREELGLRVAEIRQKDRDLDIKDREVDIKATVAGREADIKAGSAAAKALTDDKKVEVEREKARRRQPEPAE